MAPPAVPDYYLILGVHPDAKLWRLKAAARERKKELRAAGYDDDDDRMEAVEEALEALADERERLEYDEEYRAIAAAWDTFLAKDEDEDSHSDASFVDDSDRDEEEQVEVMEIDGADSEVHAEDSAEHDSESEVDLTGYLCAADGPEADGESEVDPEEYYRTGYLLNCNGVETTVEQLGRDYRCR